MSIEWLSSQIAEILHSSAENITELEKKLVVSPFSQTLVARSSYLGRLWVFIWGILGLIDCSGRLQKRAFNNTLCKINRIWSSYLTEIQAHTSVIKTLVKRSIEGSSFLSEEECKTSKKALLLAYQYIYPLFSTYGGNSSEENWQRLAKILDSPSKLALSDLEDAALLKIISRINYMLAIETVKKIVDHEPLTDKNQENLAQFLGILETFQELLSIKDLLLALKRLLFYLKREEGIGSLLWLLQKRGCPLLRQRDPFTLKKTFQLVRAFNPSFSHKRADLLFISKEEAGYVLPLTNQTALLLWENEQTLSPWRNYLLPLENIKEGYALTISWRPIDSSSLKAVASIIKSLVITAQWSPELKIEDFVQTKQGVKLIQSLPLEKEPFVYDKAFAFLQDLALHYDPSLLRSLIDEAGLSDHPWAALYRKVLHEDELPDIESLLKELHLAHSFTKQLREKMDLMKWVAEQEIAHILSYLQEFYILENGPSTKEVLERIIAYEGVLSPSKIFTKKPRELLARGLADKHKLPLLPSKEEECRIGIRAHNEPVPSWISRERYIWLKEEEKRGSPFPSGYVLRYSDNWPPISLR